MNFKWNQISKKFAYLFVAASLVLTACSSSSTSGNKDSGSSGSKDLTVAFGGDPVTLDPQNTRENMSNIATYQIFENLVAFDKDMKIVPQLAKSWKVSDDQKNWTFTLREGVKFQDGTPLNAEAVKKSFDRVINKDNKLSRNSLLGPFVDKITADSELEVTFHLKETYGPFLNALAHPGSGIISPKSIDNKGQDIGKNPVGTGPFKLKKWVPGDSLVFEVNPDYWGEKPKISTLTFKTVKENASRVVMLENGEVDAITPVPTSETERLKKSDKVNIISYPTNSFLYVGINNQKAPFNNVKVRQALNYAINKEELVQKVMQGNGKVATAAISQNTWGYSNAGAYPYDKEKAKQLLKEAGVAEGTTVRLWTTDGVISMDRQTAEFVQNSLQDIGLKVEFNKMELGSFLEALKDPNKYDLYLREGGPPTNDADWVLRALFTTGDFNNNAHFSNPEADKLIQAGLHATKEVERKKIYADLLALLKDQAPWIFLNEESGVLGTTKNVEGIVVLTTGIVDFRNVVKK